MWVNLLLTLSLTLLACSQFHCSFSLENVENIWKWTSQCKSTINKIIPWQGVTSLPTVMSNTLQDAPTTMDPPSKVPWFNPPSTFPAIHMNWCDGPMITFKLAFRFAVDTIFMQQYFVTWLIVPVYTGTVFPVHVVNCLFLSAFPYFWPVREEREIKQHIPSKNCCTWWGLSTVW